MIDFTAKHVEEAIRVWNTVQTNGPTCPMADTEFAWIQTLVEAGLIERLSGGSWTTTAAGLRAGLRS
jgi:hypothetical protein